MSWPSAADFARDCDRTQPSAPHTLRPTTKGQHHFGLDHGVPQRVTGPRRVMRGPKIPRFSPLSRHHCPPGEFSKIVSVVQSRIVRVSQSPRNPREVRALWARGGEKCGPKAAWAPRVRSHLAAFCVVGLRPPSPSLPPSSFETAVIHLHLTANHCFVNRRGGGAGGGRRGGLRSPWILPKQVRQKWCRTSSATERRDEAGCAHRRQQSCPSTFPHRRNASYHVCLDFPHGELSQEEDHLFGPAPYSLAQNNQFAAFCCQLWVCRLFVSSSEEQHCPIGVRCVGKRFAFTRQGGQCVVCQLGPEKHGKSCASTSMRLAALAGTTTFMSCSKTVNVTLAPVSWQTRASAR